VTPLLTADVADQLLAARSAGFSQAECTLDLKRSVTSVALAAHTWICEGEHYPYPQSLRERTIYHWSEGAFAALARYGSSLVKLVPTDWGPPTFEIDGIKMLPSAEVSPYADAERKVNLIRPRGKIILDTCGGLGYFAACCLAGRAERIISYEINADVLWLRGVNPWSPASGGKLDLTHGDVIAALGTMADSSVDAVLHDPPRFGIAGDLYSQTFYGQLARVLKRRGRLFHYTGRPNQVATGRDVANEVTGRLRTAGFTVERNGDGLLAEKR
jgi:predicted methyltransferase